MELLDKLKNERTELLDRLENKRLELVIEMTDALKERVFQHGETLHLKQRQLVHKDHYGNEIYDRFLIERDYFIKTVLTKDIPQHTWEFLFRDHSPETFFHAAYGDYLQEENGSPAHAFEIDHGMTPHEFEFYCCEILRQTGWEARTTVGSGDQGIDIIATWGRSKLVVQCKLYSSPVGNAAVQEIIAGREFEQADYAAVVSNATYTPSAIALANTANVLLLHYSELARVHVRLGLTADIESGVQQQPSKTVRSSARIRVGRPVNDLVYLAERLNSESQQAGVDPLYDEAIKVVLRTRRASISEVQRHLRIGYNRAARLVESMERNGLVSEMRSNGHRDLTEILTERTSSARRYTETAHESEILASKTPEVLMGSTNSGSERAVTAQTSEILASKVSEILEGSTGSESEQTATASETLVRKIPELEGDRLEVSLTGRNKRNLRVFLIGMACIAVVVVLASMFIR